MKNDNSHIKQSMNNSNGPIQNIKKDTNSNSNTNNHKDKEIKTTGRVYDISTIK